MRNMCSTMLAALLLTLTFSGYLTAENPNPQDPALNGYLEARSLLMQNRFAEAIAKFESLLAAYPTNRYADKATYYIGYCREKLGQKHRAFKRYEELLEKYSVSPHRTMAARRAVDLAQQLRQTKGDEYDQFLTKNVSNEVTSDRSLISAIRLAELEDWRGLDLLAGQFERMNDFYKMRALELFRRRMDNKKVRDAVELAFETSENEIVRMTAASALSLIPEDENARKILTQALKEDENRIIRLSSANALSRHIVDEDVEKAFFHVLDKEHDPLVINIVLDGLGKRITKPEIRNVIVERLKTEDNALVHIALSDAMREIFELPDIHIDFNIESLVQNPEPAVRLNALSMLARKVDDPNVTIVFVNTLENDPDESVKITAANVLARKAHIEQVRRAFEFTIRNSNNYFLVNTAVSALGTQIEIPNVRHTMINMLDPEQPPMVTVHLATSLSHFADEPEVQDAYLYVLERGFQPQVKELVAGKIKVLEGPARLERLERIIQIEPNRMLVELYQGLLRRVDPERVESDRD